MQTEKQLPERIKNWLNARGISDTIIASYGIHYREAPAPGYIVIPVHGADGQVLFNKYRRDPDSEEGPKYRNEKGAVNALFGAQHVATDTGPVVLCEGEFDCLTLRSQGFRAYTGTGGSSTFNASWSSHFEGERIHIVFDHDEPGIKGAYKVHNLLHGSTISWLPKEVGDHGDVTDYFTKLKKTPADFSALLEDGRAYVFPVDWRAFSLKKDLGRIKKEYAEMIEYIMAEAREERRMMRSDRHIQVLLAMYNDRYAEVSRAIKHFTVKRAEIDGTLLSKAKAVPLPLFLKFPANNSIKCLWHEEKSPSLHYYPNQNRVYCFGGCAKYFDTLDVVQKLHGVGLKEAIKIAMNAYGEK